MASCGWARGSVVSGRDRRGSRRKCSLYLAATLRGQQPKVGVTKGETGRKRSLVLATAAAGGKV